MSYTLPPAKGTATKLKYKGVFDYNGLSTYVIKWLISHKYEVTEKAHKHKMSCPHGFEIERQIEAARKVDEFYQYKVTVIFFMWDAFEVDAVKDGKKMKLWNAQLELRMDFEVVCDYTNKWATSPFYERLLKFYCNYIIKKEILIKHADPLYYNLLALHTNFKKFLGMETASQF